MEAVITLLPGDGIGPEVTECTLRVLEAVASKYGHTFSFDSQLIGGAAIDRRVGRRDRGCSLGGIVDQGIRSAGIRNPVRVDADDREHR